MLVSFKCNNCSVRTTKMISKHSYQHGLVIIVCSGDDATADGDVNQKAGCGAKHLIADRLGWFKDASMGESVEQVLRDKGMQHELTRVTDGGLLSPDLLAIVKRLQKGATGDDSDA